MRKVVEIVNIGPIILAFVYLTSIVYLKYTSLINRTHTENNSMMEILFSYRSQKELRKVTIGIFNAYMK